MGKIKVTKCPIEGLYALSQQYLSITGAISLKLITRMICMRQAWI